VRQTRVHAQSRDSARAILEQGVGRRVDAAVARIRILNEQLDEETVGRYAPERQSAWLARVERALRDLPRPEVDRVSL
jgi:hypothetical protein